MSFGTLKYIDLFSLTGRMDSVTSFGLCNEEVKRLLGIVLMFPKHEQSGDKAPSSQRRTVHRIPKKSSSA
jgi:hypothetical protein